jgi:hypothetical protein
MLERRGEGGGGAMRTRMYMYRRAQVVCCRIKHITADSRWEGGIRVSGCHAILRTYIITECTTKYDDRKISEYVL